jgi:DTW domain-containing protein YfiP
MRTLDQLAKEPRCERCARPASACVCDRLPTSPLASPIEVVILQHPQEPDVVLGTASLLGLALDRASVRVGLSWGTLEHAVGREGLDRSRWGVLFATKEEGEAASVVHPPGTVRVIPRATKPESPSQRQGSGRVSEAAPTSGPRTPLDGLIVLDGTWSQAKTLWWRNAWLLKLARVGLVPREPSMYGKLRKEPRREWVSTLEAVADVLPALGTEADRETHEATRQELRRVMRTMLQRTRDALVSHASGARKVGP